MPAKPVKPKQDAVAKAAGAATEQYLREQREAAAGPEAPATIRKRSSGDPLAGGLRKQLLPLLVLHFAQQEPTYGNQLIDKITTLTGGVLTVNPNTMYPLLRDFEARGLIEGQWEHPERRSRRFYSLTEAGEAELSRLTPGAKESLDALEATISQIKGELGA
ncbi:MAG: PadR family transcriptional regulator [Thermoleophilaceae bacterium]|nr:PadR family transcriptional regulator [Thermoleophilaceae bacterium]